MRIINDEVEFFSLFSNKCSLCGKDIFDSVMNIAIDKENDCKQCNDIYNELNEYWYKMTGKKNELNLIAKNFRARLMLKKIFKSYGYIGFHKPLILPSAIKLEVTNMCNLNCKHCLASSNILDKEELSIDQIKELLLQAKDLGVNSIAIVGGEPLLRKDLKEIIDFICELNMFYSVSTNGTLINEDTINIIKRKNLTKVSISLDGDKEFHNNLRGNDNAYDNTLRGIKILHDNDIEVAIAMVITKNNFNMIEHVINKSINNGVNYFVINDLIPIGRGKDIKNICISNEEYIELNNKMREYSIKYKDKIDILWKGMNPNGKKDSEFGSFIRSKCGAALTEITIDNKGYVLPCPFLPRTNENIKNKSLKDIWFFSEELYVYQNRNDLEGKCGLCERKLSCSGCRARALGHSNNIKAEDIRCPKTY
ncbi:radical SAM protein [Oceanotoga sp. DSM 15011]|uniref:radical SAM/SPASM domain-containing protein n=1 Tax=Oceanotoga sp. DSM 15011 TaxID=2984951 RepID=UPI0021F4859C|nr:radical SAM protein [Oceanotoga sp. DSM 15011]UYO99183.1 radical SAM protein [Oceanotoga sp. DSM 15011]